MEKSSDRGKSIPLTQIYMTAQSTRLTQILKIEELFVWAQNVNTIVSYKICA